MVEVLMVKASDVFEVAVTLIHDEHACVLVDCGPLNTMTQLKEELSKVGKSVKDITHILITHHDHDHIGNLDQLKLENPSIIVCSSAIEKDYLECSKESIRLTQAKALQPTLDKEGQARGTAFMKMLELIVPTKVDLVVSDGDVLDIVGGIKVIAAPGHMPGHLAYFALKDQALIVGDAMVVENGLLQIANPKFSLDMIEAKKTMDMLCGMPYKLMVCYHGGLIQK